VAPDVKEQNDAFDLHVADATNGLPLYRLQLTWIKRWRPSPYRAVNTHCLGYKSQSLKVVQANNHRLC